MCVSALYLKNYLNFSHLKQGWQQSCGGAGHLAPKRSSALNINFNVKASMLNKNNIHKRVIKIREGGEIWLFITLAPKVLQ